MEKEHYKNTQIQPAIVQHMNMTSNLTTIVGTAQTEVNFTMNLQQLKTCWVTLQQTVSVMQDGNHDGVGR